MMKKFCLFLIAAFSGAAALSAGDTASFVDLGFSPDGTAYMFAQYGVQSDTLRPWADLFVVDVPQNDFMSGGKVSFTHDKPVVAGSDGAGALYRLIARNAALADKYGVSFLVPGQPLFISLNGNNPEGEMVEFRDFESGASYKAIITPLVEGSGDGLKSSFYISVERTGRDGAKKTYTVGTPQVKRPLVVSYSIRKVMIAPKDGSMIFVIEMKKKSGASVDIRYMVEALRL
ncbi:MAG: DUF2259 domain-containing protein [Treponematales bacterium]